MAKVTFATDVCKGCGLCVNACPKQLIVLSNDKINKKALQRSCRNALLELKHTSNGHRASSDLRRLRL